MQPILNIAIRASRQASEYINQTLDKNDPTQSDANANEKLLSHLEESLFQTFFDSLKKANPTHFIVAPGETLSEVKEDSWHIYGIHNPAHLLRKLPSSAFSIVHKKNGKPQNALLINPFTGDEFTASRGSGAALNGRRIRCSPVKRLNESIITTNILNQLSTHAESHVISDLITELSTNADQVLLSSCDALDLAMVASGQIEAAVLSKINKNELDAALLFCQEAGALTGTFNGGMFKDNEDKIIVANPKLFKALVQRLNSYQDKL